MGLFNRHKNKEEKVIKEEIIEEAATIEVKEEPKIELPKPRFELPDDIDNRKLVVESLYNKILRLNEKVLIEYYTCKMFSVAVLHLNTEIEYFNKVAKYEYSLEYKLKEHVEKYHNSTLDNLDILYDFYELFFDDVDELERFFNDLLILKKNKYSKIVISSIAPLMNRTSKELKEIDKKVFTILCNYNSLNDAADDIYMTSGELITKLVNELVDFIKSTKNEKAINEYNYYYFLSSEIVLALSTEEWTTLYNKVTYCLKKLKQGEINHYVKTMVYFKEFEIRYLILMMQLEWKRD